MGLVQPETDEIALNVPRTRFDRAAAIATALELSRVDDLRSAGTLAAQYVLTLSAAGIAIRSHDGWVYMVAGLFIGTRVQVLGIMFHEATHYLMFSKRWVNDLVCDLFIAFPMGFSTHLYRSSHFQHHRNTSTFEDPDFVFQIKDRDQHFPKSRRDFSLLLCRSALCLNFLPMIKYGRRYSPAVNLFKAPRRVFPLHARVNYVAWAIVVLNGLYWNGLFFDVVVLYALPAFFWANFVNRVRLMAEHSGVAMTMEINATRTVIPSWLDRLLVAPIGVSYHIEHHIFPFVPGHRLPELHHSLMNIETYRTNAHVTKTYWGVFRELTTSPELAAPGK